MALTAGAGQAQAIEMFTNFHNGENIGFPPMQVPYSVYGGLGHGGWNPHATGMHLPPDPFPAVPAMTPTGQYPAGRFFDYYGAAPGHRAGMNSNVEREQLVSDRRHGRWQRGGAGSDVEMNKGNSASNEKNLSDSSRREESAGPVPAKTQAPMPATVLEIKSPDAEFLSQLQSVEVSGKNVDGHATAAGN
ncbi:MAG TPA: hypothetical protein VGI75_12670 [Pirellulales bacterium]|jgi:hypothetical protein